jgi:hypothetical protein
MKLRTPREMRLEAFFGNMSIRVKRLYLKMLREQILLQLEGFIKIGKELAFRLELLEDLAHRKCMVYSILLCQGQFPRRKSGQELWRTLL